jgi:chemotaxis protein CheC
MIDARLLLSVPTLARGSGRACLDRLVDRESGRVALATRFSTSGPGGLEGLILVLPELRRLPALLALLAAA